MKPIRIIGGILLTLFALFCVFGAMASLEPTKGSPIHTGWLIGYIIACISSATGAISLFRSGRKERRDDG